MHEEIIQEGPERNPLEETAEDGSVKNNRGGMAEDEGGMIEDGRGVPEDENMQEDESGRKKAQSGLDHLNLSTLADLELSIERCCCVMGCGTSRNRAVACA